MHTRHIFGAIALALALTGCSVYTLEIQQGNVVTKEMVDKLKPGMTRSQVRYVLGTPLISDPFHPDRWDYYYYLRRSKESTGEAQRLILNFKGDALVSVQGDVVAKSETADPKK